MDHRPSPAAPTPLVRATAQRGADGWTYARFASPTVDAVAARIAHLEGAEDAALFSSGTAAVACALLAVTAAGQRVAAARDVCADAHRLLTAELPALGRGVTWVGVDDLPGWRRALADPAVTAAYVESVSNPMLRVAALDGLAATANANGAALVVDATLTPRILQPLRHGAALVCHSAGKFLNGHGDLVAGAVAGPVPRLHRVRELRGALGACLDAGAASLLERGMRTLDVRLRAQTTGAVRIARHLAQHPAVAWTRHPALTTHPDRDRAARLGAARSAVVTFAAVGGNDRAARLAQSLRLIGSAPTLGGLESTVYLPHADPHADPGWLAHLPAGVIRLSVGLEDPRELIRDLNRALTGAAARAAAAAR